MKASTLTIKDIMTAKRNGISYETARMRIARLGWDKRRAITQQVRKATNHSKRAEENGISIKTYQARVYRYGWDKETACTYPLQEKAKPNRCYWRSLAVENGIPLKTYDSRVYSCGWDKEVAATKPVDTRFRRKTHENR